MFNLISIFWIFEYFFEIYIYQKTGGEKKNEIQSYLRL